jgi:hypothetical protein
MNKLLFAATATIALAAAVPASAYTSRGYDIGPLGQCFDPPDCGHARASYAQCPMVRERVVTASGHVIFRRHRVCS